MQTYKALFAIYLKNFLLFKSDFSITKRYSILNLLSKFISDK